MAHVLLAILLMLAPVQDQFREQTVSDEKGNSISIRHYSPPFSGAPTVIICHEWGGSSDDWHDIAVSLKKLGFGVIVYNQKGHGEDEIPYYLLADWQIETMGKDLEVALDYAVKNSGENVYVIGAGIGANIAMNVASADPRVKKLVAVSPGLNYRGIKLEKKMTATLAGRLMLIASQEDAYSVRTINLFTSNSDKPADVKFYSNSGRGVWIFKRQPESLATVARWLSDAN